MTTNKQKSMRGTSSESGTTLTSNGVSRLKLVMTNPPTSEGKGYSSRSGALEAAKVEASGKP